MKSFRIRSYSGPYFPTFGLNTKRYEVSFRVQSECEKIRTRITPNTETFYAVKSAVKKTKHKNRYVCWHFRWWINSSWFDFILVTFRIWSFSGLYFPASELNTQRYFVFLRTNTNTGKYRPGNSKLSLRIQS